MEAIKKLWYSIPVFIRKPLVLVVGTAMVVASLFLGWLPGPGGIPLFLLGIAILATEFKWAERIRDQVLAWLEPVFKWFREHKQLGSVIIVLLVVLVASGAYYGLRIYR